MEYIASQEPKSRSAGQEDTRLLWDPKIRYCVHKSPPLVPILRRIQSTPTHLRLGLPSALLFRFCNQNIV